MNYTNLIYMVLWLFVYYYILLFVPYTTDLLSNDATLGSYWSTIPSETHTLIQITLYIVVPFVAIAYTIISSKQEQTIIVRRLFKC